MNLINSNLHYNDDNEEDQLVFEFIKMPTIA